MADVQLHNRRDLLGLLGAEFRLNCPLDSQLLLAAYAKWEERCADFLLGEFSFAIWDERRNHLFCCRDHVGSRALLYWKNRTRFIFANRIERILECQGVTRELNREKLAAMAVPSGHHVRHEETFHAGIFSLPPGSWMTVERDRIRRHKYWELQIGEPVAAARPEQSYEALREILFEAVECRIDQEYPVAALLSGGLDSSAIVAIAARCLEKQNRQLTGIAAVLPEESKPEFSDEREYIDEFRSWPNVQIRYVTAAGRGPFDSLNDPGRFAACAIPNSRVFLVEECEKAAMESGARSLFWGTGGELGPTAWGNRYFVDLAARFRWLTLARELRSRRTFRNYSSIRRLAGQFLNTVSPLRGQRPLILLARDFRREYKIKPAWKSRTLYQRHHQAAEIRYWISKHAIERGQGVSLLRPSLPLADKRVLEFCLSLPASLNVKDGYPRYLMRAAMDGILPRKIQWRTGKTPVSPDYFVRYNAQLGMAREFVSGIGPRDPVRSVIDVEQLRALLVPADPAKGAVQARDEVPHTLYMINFLRQFADFRP